MKTQMSISRIATCALIMLCGIGVAEPQTGEKEPAELTKLRDSYRRQVEQAMSPIRTQYASQLDFLQKTLTRQGNLKAALAVQAELDQLHSETSGKAKASTSGHVRIKARIDGSDKILLREKDLWFQHVADALPADVAIDQKKWTPGWNGNESKRLEMAGATFRPFSKATVKIKKYRGRGSVAIDEYPTPENDNTLIIAIDDRDGGADDYEIMVSW